MRRELLGAALLVAMVLAPAQPVFAHGGNGGSTSDYRIEITGFEGDASGIAVHAVELGNRMELVRKTAKDVQILGYSGEPYIKLDADGVFENTNSPAYYINLDRFARKQPPSSATATANPNWVKLSSGSSVRWHDHRTHWMDTVPRQDVRDNPGVERVIFPANRVDLVVDGKSVVAIVRVTWIPPPPRTIWLVISSLAACVVLAALVLRAALRKLTPLLAVLASVAGVIGSGASAFRIVTSAIALLIAIVGWRLRDRWLPIAAGVIVTFLSVTHFEVFEHRLLAGWAPAAVQRVSITLALALAAAVVGSELVAGLSASAPAPELVAGES